MEIVILVALAVIVILILVAIFRPSGSSTSEIQRDDEALNQARSDNAVLESRLQSTQDQLDDALRQLNDARNVEIEKTRLQESLDNEKALTTRTAELQKSAEVRRDELQGQVQKLTAEVTGLKTELVGKDESLNEELNENSDLRKQTAELTDQVNTLTAKVSNLNTQLENAEERLVERGELEKLFGDRFKTMSSETLSNQQKQFLERATQTLKPLSDKVEKLDREWATTSGAFKQQIESLATETRTLSTDLTKPQARGQWGEI